jgi:ribonucleoside-diphosphate reductase alpha chain
MGALALVASVDYEEETSFKRDYEERAAEFIEEVESEEHNPVTALFTDAADVAAAEAKKVEADRRAKARMQGYTGNSCGECQNFTMVRNGTCEKCDTCGATSGCS